MAEAGVELDTGLLTLGSTLCPQIGITLPSSLVRAAGLQGGCTELSSPADTASGVFVAFIGIMLVTGGISEP